MPIRTATRHHDHTEMQATKLRDLKAVFITILARLSTMMRSQWRTSIVTPMRQNYRMQIRLI
jgi:hypothetical protein